MAVKRNSVQPFQSTEAVSISFRISTSEGLGGTLVGKMARGHVQLCCVENTLFFLRLYFSVRMSFVGQLIRITGEQTH